MQYLFCFVEDQCLCVVECSGFIFGGFDLVMSIICFSFGMCVWIVCSVFVYEFGYVYFGYGFVMILVICVQQERQVDEWVVLWFISLWVYVEVELFWGLYLVSLVFEFDVMIELVFVYQWFLCQGVVFVVVV